MGLLFLHFTHVLICAEVLSLTAYIVDFFWRNISTVEAVVSQDL